MIKCVMNVSNIAMGFLEEESCDSQGPVKVFDYSTGPQECLTDFLSRA